MTDEKRPVIEQRAREMAKLHERRFVLEAILRDETADPAEHIDALIAIEAQIEAIAAIRDVIRIVMLADDVAALKACITQLDEEAARTASSQEHLEALSLTSAANELRRVALEFLELMKGEEDEE